MADKAGAALAFGILFTPNAIVLTRDSVHPPIPKPQTVSPLLNAAQQAPLQARLALPDSPVVWNEPLQDGLSSKEMACPGCVCSRRARASTTGVPRS